MMKAVKTASRDTGTWMHFNQRYFNRDNWKHMRDSALQDAISSTATNAR